MESPPSILLIVSDDHAAWALHENPLDVPTPNLDRLRDEGTRFSNAFTPSPVCSPARACLMTGKMPSEVGIHDWLDESDPEVAERNWLEGQPTLPQTLKKAGYQTFLSGKWHLGHPGQIPPGFDHAFGMSPRMRTHTGQDLYFLDGEKHHLTGNRSRLITDHALEFLKQADPNRPFYLQVGYFSTHSPYNQTDHDPKTLADLPDSSFPDMPRVSTHPHAKNENGPHPERDPETERRARWRGYASGVAEIDRGLGRLLDALKQSGQLENTLLVYTADHGCCLGHHGIWGKGNGTRPVNFYDTSLRVPLILRGPGIPSGETNARSVTHLDTHATLLEVAGMPLPDVYGQPGASLFHPDLSDETVYAEYGDARMIRTPQWKLIAYAEDHSERLFDLTRDPGETRDLANDPAFHAVRKTLRTKLLHAFTQFSNPAHDGLRILDTPPHNPYEPWNTRRKQPQGTLP